MIKYYIKVLQNYANFEGRARRSEYWYFFLGNVIIGIVLGIVGVALFGADLESQTMAGLPGNIYSLATLVPSIAVAIRRMHDVGKSGWFVLIPIYNIILACTDSDQGDNQYGPNPKNEANVELLD
jgi:uncharacterized membrane protein YhaH (DUF805 family)